MPSSKKTAKIEASDIRNLVEQSIESSEPQGKILEYLKARDGKTLTRRDEPKLREFCGDSSIRFYHSARNLCYLEWGGYERSGGHEGGALFLAYTDGAPKIDAKFVEERNAAYFSAARERNEARKSVLAQGAFAFEDCAGAINALQEARERLARLFAFGDGPLAADRYRIEEYAKSLGIDIKER
jgi:hypothetical protein